ncbi:ATP-grasp domain-containing protein [Sneathiella sp. P13V-1]|uniref:acetyl/propionyl/methylcrotonyl-CoA carboxylase subunit alpha n=1 Tax=Sneathiella sp. P13V-1 TaxID=2697366 RepID=UPI00187BA2C7|nr:acetyl/propionyl/methylcrotonyl-CoA carboxylase subunit alpha [Sneathiella sp. P13V-1]MBE7636821.1 ATP-grasp domain-containing protein [Sneathiella sp. P13V-1]
MFRKILIANRGEIACRVMDTARKMGIKTVAVYSEADATSRHVQMADEAVLLGPAEVSESYLKADKILDIAKMTGAEAIHPGYGFLSENAEFADKCEKEGVVFIGPPSDAIRAMGLKDAAKAMMEEANVPVVPGYHGEDQDPDMLAKEAERIGYPVLIKAVAGGGGKGMRRVDSAAEFPDALGGAQREAANAFGDDRVLIEKFLVKPRHIEIQVFADGQGNAVHLFERDCSLQRRHQKVIEEAPAPGMPVSMREAMGAAAVAAAKAINYEGAGTVEFIADVSDGLKEDGFFFMEMNTRLQVEHPVTELITGQDLVEWQLIVASGGALPVTQDELSISGHSFEARLYAEDPHNDFLPATGPLLRLRAPAEVNGVRVDTGVREGDNVTPFYDPMIAKLVVWDENRDAALRKLGAALGNYQVAGLVTNLEFLKNVAASKSFADADLDTGFIDRFRDELIPEKPPVTNHHLALVSLWQVLTEAEEKAAIAADSNDPYSPWNDTSSWRMNDRAHHDYTFAGNEGDIDVMVSSEDGKYIIDVAGSEILSSATLLEDGSLRADLDGHIVQASVVRDDNRYIVIFDGKQVEINRVVNDFDGTGDDGGAGAITSPMPGKIIQMAVAAGDTVAKGDTLAVMEAMKMEHSLTAAADGTVAEVYYEVGDQVDEGELLIRLEAEEEG